MKNKSDAIEFAKHSKFVHRRDYAVVKSLSINRGGRPRVQPSFSILPLYFTELLPRASKIIFSTNQGDQNV